MTRYIFGLSEFRFKKMRMMGVGGWKGKWLREIDFKDYILEWYVMFDWTSDY